MLKFAAPGGPNTMPHFQHSTYHLIYNAAAPHHMRPMGMMCVAGMVGLACIGVFGTTDASSISYLTNADLEKWALWESADDYLEYVTYHKTLYTLDGRFVPKSADSYPEHLAERGGPVGNNTSTHTLIAYIDAGHILLDDGVVYVLNDIRASAAPDLMRTVMELCPPGSEVGIEVIFQDYGSFYDEHGVRQLGVPLYHPEVVAFCNGMVLNYEMITAHPRAGKIHEVGRNTLMHTNLVSGSSGTIVYPITDYTVAKYGVWDGTHINLKWTVYCGTTESRNQNSIKPLDIEVVPVERPIGHTTFSLTPDHTPGTVIYDSLYGPTGLNTLDGYRDQQSPFVMYVRVDMAQLMYMDDGIPMIPITDAYDLFVIHFNFVSNERQCFPGIEGEPRGTWHNGGQGYLMRDYNANVQEYGGWSENGRLSFIISQQMVGLIAQYRAEIICESEVTIYSFSMRGDIFLDDIHHLRYSDKNPDIPDLDHVKHMHDKAQLYETEGKIMITYINNEKDKFGGREDHNMAAQGIAGRSDRSGLATGDHFGIKAQQTLHQLHYWATDWGHDSWKVYQRLDISYRPAGVSCTAVPVL